MGCAWEVGPEPGRASVSQTRLCRAAQPWPLSTWEVTHWRGREGCLPAAAVTLAIQKVEASSALQSVCTGLVPSDGLGVRHGSLPKKA